MTDNTITALLSLVTGAVVFEKASGMDMSLTWSAAIALFGMAAAALVTWGMFKKATERHEAEIEILRSSLSSIHKTLADVRERVARIEGKLENNNATPR
jgi:hypothetical protein